jgi:putative flippase GtrA
MQLLKNKFFQFTGAGALNSLVTYFIYILSLNFFSYRFSYTLAFSLGIFLGYFLNVKFVFSVTATKRRFLWSIIIYLSIYSINLILIDFFVLYCKIWVQFAPLAVAFFTSPIGFLLNKRK